MTGPHELLLTKVSTPVLLTHHARTTDAQTGNLIGAMSDFQARKTGELIAGTGSPLSYQAFPDAQHAMHATDPQRFANVLAEWEQGLPPAPA